MEYEGRKAWGSDQAKALLARLGIKASGSAMAEVIDLDYCSRNKKNRKMLETARSLATLRVESGALEPSPENEETVRKLSSAILREYDRMDRAFQPEAYATDGAGAEQADTSASDKFNAALKKAKRMMVSFMVDGDSASLKSYSDDFAKSAISNGWWKKPASDLVKPLMLSAKEEAKKILIEKKKANTASNGVLTGGQNGIQLPTAITNDADFRSAGAELAKAHTAKDGKALHKAIEDTTLQAMRVIREGFLGFRVNTTMIQDFFLSAAQQKEMETWENAPPAEFTTDLRAVLQQEEKEERERTPDASSSSSTDYYSDSEADYDEMNNSRNDYLKLGASDVRKVDMKSVASVYGFGEDDADALESIALDAVKKGADNPGVQKSAKDLLAQSKKKKKSPKAKNGRHLAFALIDAVRKALSKQKVTKPMKESEITE